jgi:uncharacterized RDD family membrane protein YckC
MSNNTANIDNLELASLRSRLRAFIIDDLSITLLVVVILWDQLSAANSDPLVMMGIMNQAFVQIVILKFLYQTIFIWYYGATLGKFVAKIKVIDFDHFGKVSLLNAAIRSFGRIISESLFYIGFMLAYYTDSRQTFHDKFGKTLVVNV